MNVYMFQHDGFFFKNHHSYASSTPMAQQGQDEIVFVCLSMHACVQSRRTYRIGFNYLFGPGSFVGEDFFFFFFFGGGG